MVAKSEASPIADEINRRIEGLQDRSTGAVRKVRREYSKRLRTESPDVVRAVAMALLERHRWVAYELLYHHPDGFNGVGIDEVEALGRGLDSWASVDAFARYISGASWQRGLISDDDVRRWTTSPDRFWRRAALVSTVPLNLRAAGGTGDARRTLEICTLLVDDRDDTVVKALSWALRELVLWDPDAVRSFVDEHDDVLAARVKREVRSKLETGRKN